MNIDQPSTKPKTFTFINNERLTEIIKTAKRHIIFAAPGISKSVAESLCAFADNHENGALRVILDADPEALRLGFGDSDGIALLSERGVDLRRAPGLRIGVLVTDEKAWVYAPTPEIILEQPIKGIHNGLEVHVEFARQILFSIAPDIKVIPDDDILDQQIIRDDSILELTHPDLPNKDILDVSFLTDDPTPEIGTERFCHDDLKKIDSELKESPPQKFDATRKVRVYQGYFQFVELSFSGCRLSNKTISLPKYLLNIKDEDLRNRVKTTCRVLGESSKSSFRVKMFEEKIRDLRKQFICHLDDRFGSVILRSKRAEFDKKIGEFSDELKELRKSIKDDLKAELDGNAEKLGDMLLPGLIENPPGHLFSRGKQVDEKWAREALEYKIKKQMPDPDDLIEKMDLHCDYKDVTYEMLNGETFIKAVKKNYPEMNFDKLYSETDTIAERKTDGQNVQG